MYKQAKLRINFIINHRIDGSIRIRVFNLIDAINSLEQYQVSINATDYDYDVCIFHRYTDLKTLQIHRQKGIYTCFDLDDLFTSFFDMIKYVDLVITSTDFLKKQLQDLNKNVIVVPNCLDIDDINIPLKKSNNHKKICWYGWWQNAGILQIWNIKNITTISNKISNDYDGLIYDSATIDRDLQKFDLVIIPQEKNDSTLAKTHCRALKAMYLGIPVMMSNMPEYLSLAKILDIPKDFIIKNHSLWNQKIQDFKDGKLKFDFDFKLGRQKIINNFSRQKIAWNLTTQIYKKWKNRNKDKMDSISRELNKFLRYKIFIRSKMPNGVRVFYLFGIKIYSYQKKIVIQERK